jgi:hypothetical protein
VDVEKKETRSRVNASRLLIWSAFICEEQATTKAGPSTQAAESAAFAQDDTF